jgi:hypothetical protein
MTSEMFAPRLLSADRDIHSCPAFSKDGDYVFWRTMNSHRGDGVYYMERKNGRWTGPRRAWFLNQDADVPYFPCDDQTLYFISERESGGIRKRRIWFTRRTDGKWEEPKCLAAFDPPIDWLHWQFTFSSRGNICFTGIQKDGFGDYDLFVATKVGASYSYKILAEPLNSVGSNVCPYCAPAPSRRARSSIGRRSRSFDKILPRVRNSGRPGVLWGGRPSQGALSMDRDVLPGIDVEDDHRRFGPMAWRRCRQLLGHGEAALDALQGIFVRLMKSKDRIASPDCGADGP